MTLMANATQRIAMPRVETVVWTRNHTSGGAALWIGSLRISCIDARVITAASGGSTMPEISTFSRNQR